MESCAAVESQPAVVAPAEPAARRRPWLWAAAVAVVFGTTRNLTLPAAVMVVVAGAGMGVAPWIRERRIRRAAVPTRGLVVWTTLVVGFCLWELAAFLLGNDTPHPTFSMLAEPMLAVYPIRAVAMFAWLLWGWHLSAPSPAEPADR